jgi:Na+/proline symporter
VAASGCNESLPTCTPTVIAQIEWFQALAPSEWTAKRSDFPLPTEFGENRAWAEPPAASPFSTYVGIDGEETTSRSAWGMMSFNLMFFSMALFPHLLMKLMAVRSEKDLRIASFSLTLCGVISTLPMLLVGITASAVFAGIYPNKESEVLGTILADMANRGGWSEGVGAVAATGAVMALMSTIESALLSLTNLMATDVLRNWIMQGARDLSIIRIGNMLALITMAGCVLIALHNPNLARNDTVYTLLIEWQASLLWQTLPVMMISMYWDVNGWACLIGQVCGIACIAGLWWQRDACHNWNTAYAWKSSS